MATRVGNRKGIRTGLGIQAGAELDLKKTNCCCNRRDETHHPSPSLSFPSSSMSLLSILSPFRLHSVFHPVSFPPLSFRYIYSTCAGLTHSLLIAYSVRSSSPSIQYLFSLSSFPFLNLAIIFLSLVFSRTPCCISII
jgi:hypothetical protein